MLSTTAVAVLSDNHTLQIHYVGAMQDLLIKHS